MAKAILLDVDGTLVNSNEAHARAWVDVGREAGFEIHYEQVRPLVGMGGDKVLPRLTGLFVGTSQGDQIVRRHGEIFRQRYLPGIQPFHGTHALLEFLRQRGLRLVIATSAGKQDLAAILEHAGLKELVDDQTSSQEVDASKPDPDVVQAALAKAGVSPDQALFLGDTPYDVEAARRAGVSCIALRCGGWWSDADFRGAIGIHDDPAALMEEWRY